MKGWKVLSRHPSNKSFTKFTFATGQNHKTWVTSSYSSLEISHVKPKITLLWNKFISVGSRLLHA